MAQAPPQPASEYVIRELVLHAAARVHRWEEKAGFSFLFEYESSPTPRMPATSVIPRGDVVDITSSMGADGTLDWDVPAGRWTILRMGYSLTGAKNRPAVPAGAGLRSRQAEPRAHEAYLRDYTEPSRRRSARCTARAPHVLLDSWEAGMQNWTDDMIAEFRARRGYDPTPYLPALAGRVVESAETSDRFLWDFRRTLVDMFAENHYAHGDGVLPRAGLRTYSEAAGVSLEPLEDALLNKKQVDIPMGEFWFRVLHPWLMYYEDVRGAASASHVYGKPLVAAEALTGGGYESPYSLKKIGDYWLAQGINRLVFHTSAHQPLDTKPGNTMVGTHINRNITWAEQAAPFMTYLARSSYMLQQGKPSPISPICSTRARPRRMPFWGAGLQPAPPTGYDYDYINADALLTRMSVGGGWRARAARRHELSRARAAADRPHDAARAAQDRRARARRRNDRRSSPDAVAEPRRRTGSRRRAAALAEEMWGDLDGASRTRRGVGPDGGVGPAARRRALVGAGGARRGVQHAARW